MLYERDYNNLTTQEQEQIEKAEQYKREKITPGIIDTKTLMEYHKMRPYAARHYDSIFPNNLLKVSSLEDKTALERVRDEFVAILNRPETTERDLLNYINRGNYNIIASLFHSGYTFGHHGAYLFYEFELPSTYYADYLLVGKNSHGYHFVFVELENPSGNITTQDGEFGVTIRKGIKQVQDWDRWLERNYASLKLIFDKYKNPRINLPKEFYQLDKSRINYVVVAGRRQNFNENTYELKRRLSRTNNINLLHYDNVIDNYNWFLQTNNY